MLSESCEGMLPGRVQEVGTWGVRWLVVFAAGSFQAAFARGPERLGRDGPGGPAAVLDEVLAGGGAGPGFARDVGVARFGWQVEGAQGCEQRRRAFRAGAVAGQPADAIAVSEGEAVGLLVDFDDAVYGGVGRQGAEHGAEGGLGGLLAHEQVVGGLLERELSLGAAERHLVACLDLPGPAGAWPVSVVEHAQVDGAGPGGVVPYGVRAQDVMEHVPERLAGEQVADRDAQLLAGQWRQGGEAAAGQADAAHPGGDRLDFADRGAGKEAVTELTRPGGCGAAHLCFVRSVLGGRVRRGRHRAGRERGLAARPGRVGLYCGGCEDGDDRGGPGDAGGHRVLHGPRRRAGGWAGVSGEMPAGGGQRTGCRVSCAFLASCRPCRQLRTRVGGARSGAWGQVRVTGAWLSCWAPAGAGPGAAGREVRRGPGRNSVPQITAPVAKMTAATQKPVV